MSKENENHQGFFKVRTLPAPDYASFWKDIIIADEIKKKLLNYCRTMPKLDILTKLTCAIYGMVLIYGKPGTGKTSIALGCANEVARMEFDKTGKKTKLLELNLSTLFSEFLGRSVKGVIEAFAAIRLAARHCLVIVHLSEVESVGIDRSSLGSGDPSDVMRSVNALLTEMDELRYSKGVVILATSNFTQKVDRALWDRSDLTVYLGLPGRDAARKIVKKSFRVLRRYGVTVDPAFYDVFAKQFYANGDCKKLSGRALSRLPINAVWDAGNLNLSISDVMNVAESIVNGNGKE